MDTSNHAHRSARLRLPASGRICTNGLICPRLTSKQPQLVRGRHSPSASHHPHSASVPISRSNTIGNPFWLFRLVLSIDGSGVCPHSQPPMSNLWFLWHDIYCSEYLQRGYLHICNHTDASPIPDAPRTAMRCSYETGNGSWTCSRIRLGERVVAVSRVTLLKDLLEQRRWPHNRPHTHSDEQGSGIPERTSRLFKARSEQESGCSVGDSSR